MSEEGCEVCKGRVSECLRKENECKGTKERSLKSEMNVGDRERGVWEGHGPRNRMRGEKTKCVCSRWSRDSRKICEWNAALSRSSGLGEKGSDSFECQESL